MWAQSPRHRALCEPLYGWGDACGWMRALHGILPVLELRSSCL